MGGEKLGCNVVVNSILWELMKLLNLESYLTLKDFGFNSKDNLVSRKSHAYKMPQLRLELYIISCLKQSDRWCWLYYQGAILKKILLGPLGLL